MRDQVDSERWTPYTEWTEQTPTVNQPALTHTLSYYGSLLSEIVNDTVVMFYAPHERFTSKKLLGYYERYLQWYKSLPTKLRMHAGSAPHVIALQWVLYLSIGYYQMLSM